MKAKLKTTLVNDSGDEFMGIGLVWLLRAIDEVHSIQRAAEELGLSYVKALKILNRLEENLPEPVITRKRGGHERGGAELTVFGRRFLEAYDGMQQQVKQLMDVEFEAFRGKVGL